MERQRGRDAERWRGGEVAKRRDRDIEKGWKWKG